MPAAPPAAGLKRSLLTLVATPNGAATDVLVAALASEVANVRVGAAKALAARADEESHRALVIAVGDCPSDARMAVATPAIAKRLRPVVTAAIGDEEEDVCRRACRYAIDAEDSRVLAAVVDAALKPGHPFVIGLSSASVRLARSLAAEIESKNQGEDAPEDPAFARRTALQSLGRAIEKFGEHQRLEMLDAFLMITTYNNPVLRRVLKDDTHAARRPLLDALRTSSGFGAMDVLINAIEDNEAPPLLLQIAAERADRAYTERLLRHIGERPGVRAIHNARKLKGFGFAAIDRQERLLALAPQQQAAAMRLQTAADTKPEERLELATLLIKRGGDAGRVAAFETLRRAKSADVKDLLELGLKDTCPDVVAMAACQLRRQMYPGALEHLVSLLDHPAEVVVSAAQKGLGEFSFESYQAVYEKLSPEQRSAAGRLVGRADPEAIKSLGSRLRAPIVEQRREAIGLIGEMGLVDRVLEDIVNLRADRDSLVRSEVARVLGGSQEEAAISALATMLGDKHAGVRGAAEASLRQLDSLEVAEQLLAELQADETEGSLGEAE